MHSEVLPEFEAVFAALPGVAAVFAADPPSFTLLAASDALLAVVHRPREAVVGQGLVEAFHNACPGHPHSSGLTDLAASLATAVRTGARQHMDRQRYELPGPDGTWETQYWDAVNIPVPGPDGAVRHVLHQTADVTAQVRGEAAAARDAYRLALTDALRSAPDPIEAQAAATRVLGDHLGASRVMYGEADPGSTETFTNHREYRRDPAMPTALGGHRWDDFGAYVATELHAGRTLVVDEVCVHPGHLADDLAAYAAVGIRAYVAVPLVREGRIVAYLAVNHTKQKAWTAEEIALVEETAERTWAAVERARAEAALRKSEEKYRALFEQMDEAYAVVEVMADATGRWVDFRFLEVNPAFMRHTGMPHPVGRTATELLGTPNPRWAELYGRAADTGASVRVVEEELVLGRVFDLNIFRLGGAGSRRVAVLFTDITERKRAEEALKENDRRKDEFLAMLGHELRNPLAPIRTVSALLDKRLGTLPEYQPVLGVLARQTMQLTRLVDDLLDVARLTQGRVTLKFESVECGSVIEQAIETVRTLAAEKSHQLRIHRPDENLYVSGDRARLVQTVTNLLHNAIKYTDPHGTITVAVSPTEQEFVLTVQDTGIGISAELLPHIFDLFMQSERSLDRSQGGLGIGLSVARHLVAMHHGTLQAHSAGHGQGSTFEIRLPRIPATHRVEEAVVKSGAPRRILIVDDNRDAADSLALLLTSEGHDVDVVYRSTDALDRVAQQHRDIVILDIGMPDLDGYTVARTLRARHGKALRVIALTGYGGPEDRERSDAAGFDAHLVKPVDVQTLRCHLGI